MSKYAGFWLRVVASLLDGLILLIPVVVIASAFDRFFILFATILVWQYYALQESGIAQATLGKKVLGLKVTDLKGRRITYGRATGRYFAKIVSQITLTIGYMMAGFTEKKQALHDMIADTLVIRSG